MSLEGAVDAMKRVPWTALEGLKGDPEILKKLDDAEALLKSLRQTLARPKNSPCPGQHPLHPLLLLESIDSNGLGYNKTLSHYDLGTAFTNGSRHQIGIAARA